MLKTIFNPENPVFCFINKVIDLVVLSLLWFVCCLPIVTIGPAMAALYYAVVKSVRRQRSYAVREFQRAFKENLKQGIPVHLVFAALGIMMLLIDLPLAFTLLDTDKAANAVLLSLLGAKLFLYLGMICWIYPLMSRFGEKTWKLAEASLYLLLRYLPVTVASVILLAASGILLLWEPLLFAVIPGAAAFVVSLMMEPALRKLCREQEAEEAADTWYLERR